MNFEALIHQLAALPSTTEGTASHAEESTDVRFAVIVENEEPFLEVRNAKNQPTSPDSRYHSGDVGGALRAIEAVAQRKFDEFSWAGRDQRISLWKNPFLVYQIVRCTMTNDDGHTLQHAETAAVYTLHVEPTKNGYDTSLTLDCGEEHLPLKQCTLLNECYALHDRTIYGTESLGTQFEALQLFEASIKKSQLETFLSLFYSLFPTTVALHFGTAQVFQSTEAIEARTALVFEKVDEDHTLYMRLAAAMPGDSDAVLNNTMLKCAATLTPDSNVELRMLRLPNLEEEQKCLLALIRKCGASKNALSQVYADNEFILVPQTVGEKFLFEALPLLTERYVLLGTNHLRAFKLEASTPQLHIGAGTGIDYLDCHPTVELGDETFLLKDFLRQFEKQRYIQLSNGNRALVNDRYMKRLSRIFKKADKKGNYEVSFFDLPELDRLLEAPKDAPDFCRHREVYEGFNNLKQQKIKLPHVNATLRDYQREGVKWINYLYENKLGGCLADDMGLGKTLQTISMLTRIYPKEKKSTLIVMPRSLLFNWQSELARFAPQLTVYTYYGTTRDMDEALSHQIILTTYAMVRNNVQTFREQKFHYIVLDESQNIKNLTAQSTQAVLLLKGDHRLALSGTPIENNLTELYSLFRFLNPAMFGSLKEFNELYTVPITKQADREVTETLRRKINPFMLRRLKKDVLTELPDRIEQTLYVEMEPEQAELYERRRAYYQTLLKGNIKEKGLQQSQFLMFQALGELRRLASVPETSGEEGVTSPKLQPLMDSLTDAVAGGHKAVVFFNYIAGIEIVSEALEKEGISHVVMTGATTDRKSIVERFQTDRSVSVMLMTLKTGGVGLNLTAADMVYIFEPWWNRAAEEQAINRLHRFGQKNTVLSYSLITRCSIEEKIQELQRRKADLFEGLITSDSAVTKVLTEEDIDFILSGSDK